MSCALTSDYTYLGCKGGAGGIKAVYMTEIANNATFAVTAGVVTTWTLTTGKEFKKYLLDKEMGFFTNAGTYTPNSGTVSYEPQIDFTVKKLTSTMIQEMHLIAQNTLMMIVQDVNDDYWAFGCGGSATEMNGRGMDLMTWSNESGTAITDFNGSKMSFKGKEIGPIYRVTSSLITTLTAPAS